MNRSFLVPLAVLIGSFTAPIRLYASPVLNIDAPATVALGGAFTVQVDIADVTDLYAFQFDVTFDPTILSATSSDESTFLPGGGPTFFIPGVIDNAGGTVAGTADTLLGTGPGVSGSGILATFSFSAFGDGTSQLTLSNVLLLDSSLNPIDVGLYGASVDVGGAAAVPEPATIALVLAGLAAARRARTAGRR